MSENEKMNTPIPKIRVWDYNGYNDDEISQYDWNNTIIGEILELCDDTNNEIKLDIPEKFKNMFLNLNLPQSAYQITYNNSDNNFIIVNSINILKIENYEYESLINTTKINDLVDQFYNDTNWHDIKYKYLKNLPNHKLNTTNLSLWDFNVNKDTYLNDDLAYRLLILSILYFNNKGGLNSKKHLYSKETLKRDVMRSKFISKKIKTMQDVRKEKNEKLEQHIVNTLYSNILNNNNNKIILDFMYTDENIVQLILHKYAKDHSLKLSDLNLTINNKWFMFNKATESKFASVAYENDERFYGNNHIIVNDDLKIIVMNNILGKYHFVNPLINAIKNSEHIDNLELLTKEMLQLGKQEKIKIVGPPRKNVDVIYNSFNDSSIDYIKYNDNMYICDDHHEEFYIFDDEYLYFNPSFINWDNVDLNELK